MQFVFLHGEGWLFGWLLLLSLAAIALLSIAVGWWRYKSKTGVALAGSYLLLAAAPCLLSRSEFWLMILGIGVTLPWSLFLPDIFIDSIGNRALPTIMLVCAGLNAAAIYFMAAWFSRPEEGIA